MNEREIFLAALKQPTVGERAAFLDQACGSDATLRGHIDALLAEHEQLGSYLESPLAAGQRTHDKPPVAERPGAVIGPYKILQQLGEGGMGTVWMAQQLEPVKRMVALKLIKAGMNSKQVIARFEAERQALAVMDHVNIARVLDAGTTETGLPYFVMELVHGVSITKYCDDNHLTPRERLELFVPVCQAIQHAHQKGIIHRDLKPSNVMITLYDGKPVPKVIDFGVAKATEQTLTERTLFTQYGTMVGTLEYMSPEQAEMSALGVDTRSDIYSLGVLLYELLTGSTPLTHKHMNEAAHAEILRMIKEEEPPKPSTRLSDSGEALASISAKRHTEPAKLTKLVRGELDWIVMKTLEKDRNRRYETAKDFAADVQRYLDDEQVLACPPSVGYRLKKFLRRNKIAVGVGGVIAASLALAVGSLLVANEALAAKNAETLRAKEQTDDALGERTKVLAEKTTALTEKSIALMDLKNAHETLERKTYYQGITLGELRLLNIDVFGAERELGNCPLHLRDWEWHYLKSLCRTEIQVLNQGNPLFEIRVSPDGQRLAAQGYSYGKNGRRPSEIKIWGLPAGRLLFRHVGTQDNALGVYASPNCLWVASVHENGTVDVWDVGNGKKAWTVRGTRRLPGEFLDQALFSPDGERLATRTDANEVQLWDLKTEKLLRTLPGPGSEMTGWTFSHDGRQLVTSGYQKDGKNRGEADAVAHVWDVVSGNKLFTLAGGAFQPSFSRDGLLALLTPSAKTVKVWDLKQPEGQLVHTLQPKGAKFFSVNLSPDGQWVATTSPANNLDSVNQELTVWSVKSGLALYSLRKMDHPRFSADGQRLAAINGAQVRIWRAATGQELLTLRGHYQGINSIVFLEDGRLASAGDNEIRLWDTANPQESRIVSHTRGVLGVAFSPDGRLGTSLSATEIKVWEAATGKEIKSWSFLAGGPNPKIHFSRDGTRIAAVEIIKGVSPRMLLKVWEATTGTELFTLEGTPLIRQPSFSPDGKWIATAGGELGKPSGVFIWDAVTGNGVKVLLGLDSDVKNVSISPDSKLIAATTVRELKIWDLTTGKEVFSKQLILKRVSKGRVLFSPDGRRLAWVGGEPAPVNSEMKVWDLATGEELLSQKTRDLGSVAFSPDSRFITSAGPNFPAKIVHLWDVATGKKVAQLASVQGQVQLVAFNPKGNRIAVATRDGNVKLWDAATYQEMLVLRGHSNEITDVTFSSDGHRIATASLDRTVRIWDATPRK